MNALRLWRAALFGVVGNLVTDYWLTAVVVTVLLVVTAILGDEIRERQ